MIATVPEGLPRKSAGWMPASSLRIGSSAGFFFATAREDSARFAPSALERRRTCDRPAGQYDGQVAHRAPQSFYDGELQVLGVTMEGYKIQLDPKESQVVWGQVTRAVLHVCTQRPLKQVGGRTDIWSGHVGSVPV